MTLPYTWTDPVTGATLTVGTDITEITADGEGHYVDSPVGDAARALAGAVLDAGGVECSIIPADELEQLTAERDAARDEVTLLRAGARRRDALVERLTQERDAAREEGARSMRDRADQAIQSAWPRLADRRTPAEQCGQVVRAVRALPLLADTDRPDLADLPAEDLVEPGDEVPAIVELADRLHAVEQRLGMDSEAAGCLAFTADPAHPRDAMYCEHPAGEGHTGRHYADTWVWDSATEPGAPCEVCGRTPDAQETGPDGACRHTPATRLGRPKDTR